MNALAFFVADSLLAVLLVTVRSNVAGSLLVDEFLWESLCNSMNVILLEKIETYELLPYDRFFVPQILFGS